MSRSSSKLFALSSYFQQKYSLLHSYGSDVLSPYADSGMMPATMVSDSLKEKYAIKTWRDIDNAMKRIFPAIDEKVRKTSEDIKVIYNSALSPSKNKKGTDKVVSAFLSKWLAHANRYVKSMQEFKSYGSEFFDAIRKDSNWVTPSKIFDLSELMEKIRNNCRLSKVDYDKYFVDFTRGPGYNRAYSACSNAIDTYEEIIDLISDYNELSMGLSSKNEAYKNNKYIDVVKEFINNNPNDYSKFPTHIIDFILENEKMFDLQVVERARARVGVGSGHARR